jgi:Holliday junction resolvasome RuvABC DNA-binding subunit
VNRAEATEHGVGATTAGSPCATGGTHVATPTWAPSKLDVAVIRAQAKTALMGLGWKPAVARAAVAAAHAALGLEATLEALISESLRRCPRPMG